jgi:hypothetical protein
VRTHTKLTTLVMAASVVAASLVLGGTASGSSGALARAGAGEPKVVKLRATESKVKIDDAKFRPGVTEFRVKETAKKGSSLIILETDDLDRAFKLLGTAFSGGPGSADAMKKFDRIVTIYGGGHSGARWQVKLTEGAYYVLDIKTNALTTFRVKGEKRPAKMMRPDSTITTTKDNQFETSGRLMGPWIAFHNHSREIHFMDAARVAERTTGSDVRKALESPKDPKWIRPGGFTFEVESPGVKTVYRQDVDDGKYLLACFMPSEEQDGVPHAMMGMWKLVHGG